MCKTVLGQFPDGHFSEGLLTDSSPKTFPRRTFPRWEMGYKWVVGHLELPTRNSTRDISVETFFQAFQNSSFSEHPLKNVCSNFLESFSF